MNIHQLPPDVLHIQVGLKQPQDDTAELSSQNPDAASKAFDVIAAWCDAEQLFIGGSLANAVVYAPIRPISPSQIKRLRRLILSQPGVASCQMKLLVVSYLQSASDKAACLEAFSQAQRYLAEKLAEGADALAGLMPAGPRSWRVTVAEKCTRLELHHEALQIWLALMPLDATRPESPVPDFARFNKQLVSLSDLHMFIPDWLDLHWTQVLQHPEADLSVGRWLAESGGWKIWITGNPSAQLTHREVMLRWMGAVGAA